MTPVIDYVFLWKHEGISLPASEQSKTLPSHLTWEQALAEVTWPGYEKTYTVTPVRKEWPKWAWPGGYPIYYMTKDGGVLSANAANAELERTLDPDDDQFFIVAADINYEDTDLYCDHTGERIECAYGDDEVEP